MTLSEIKGEKALDVLADILEPAQEIMTDEEVVKNFRVGGNRIAGIAQAIRAHKKAVISILAALDGADPETYEVNVLTLPKKLLEIVNDEAMLQLFPSPARTRGKKRSGPRMVTTTGNGQ